ncbi:RNA polymerase sigma factor [Mucilaginibacter ginsenosidivorax]|uniref:RNA polymerase sigma-70 factor n=1 Tax=Mucilaginibacter ginsenosidivorax TaxID=862126 RepID=A0A5B8W646_9SPHI|nr:RNA polymerase sigma-70 factor [Mucilaginibacter ginsenosidivorax]QEC78426.1 RNA polymerase sigma-70 factor [Mucilaginibacter ginsenosidivorax]
MTTLKHFSDSELVDLFKSGDQAAYVEIYDRYTLTLFNHAYNKTRNREEAKDVVQEVFTTLWAKRDQINFQSNLSGYLYTSLRNNILNRIARQSILDKYTTSLIQFIQTETSQIITDHLIREHELAALIEKEIAALPSKMRQVFELSRKQHLSHKEIAAQLDISEQTVSKHVTNALKILRVRLGFFIYLLMLFHLL